VETVRGGAGPPQEPRFDRSGRRALRAACGSFSRLPGLMRPSCWRKVGIDPRESQPLARERREDRLPGVGTRRSLQRAASVTRRASQPRRAATSCWLPSLDAGSRTLANAPSSRSPSWKPTVRPRSPTTRDRRSVPGRLTVGSRHGRIGLGRPRALRKWRGCSGKRVRDRGHDRPADGGGHEL
jgi:hypothetical protein